MENPVYLYNSGSTSALPPASLIPTNVDARNYFRRHSDRLLGPKIKTSELREKGEIYRDLSDFRMSLERAYMPPAYSLMEHTATQLPEKAIAANSRIGRLVERLGQQGPNPISDNGKSSLNGWGMHARVVRKSTYWVTEADDKIHRDNCDLYAEKSDGANVVEVCVGNGVKAARFLRREKEAGAIPASITINDIVRTVVEGEALNNIQLETGMENIVTLPGDIHSEVWWKSRAMRDLKKSQARTFLRLHGATFNDFSSTDMKKLFKRCAEHLKPGSTVAISIDSTQQGLLPAYDYPEVHQWLTLGFIHSCWKVGFDIDPSAVDIQINQKKAHDFTAIEPFVRITKDQIFEGVKNPSIKNERFRFILEAGSSMPYDDVRKINEAAAYKMAADAGMENIRPLRYVEDNDNNAEPRFPHVRQAVWMFDTPKAA